MGMISCDKSKEGGANPLLGEWDTQFEMPPFNEIKPEHFKPALEDGIKLQLAVIDTIVGNADAPTFENVILALDKSGERYSRIATMLGLLDAAHGTPELKKVYAEMAPVMSKHSDDLYLNEALFNKVKAVYEKRNDSNLNALQIRLTEKYYDAFFRSGAALADADKDRLRKINEELSLAQMNFGNNIVAATKAFTLELDSTQVEDLPASLKTSSAETAEAMGKSGKFVFTLDNHSVFPFLSNSSNEALREQIYKAYINRCDGGEFDNKPLIDTILSLRYERAKMMGYKNHAEFMTADRMAKTPEAVYSILNDLWEPALNLGKSELAEMQQIKKNETGRDDFNAWDWWYYAEKLRKSKYNLNDEELRPYFSIEAVRAGIFDLSNKLYGLTFRPLSNVPSYHKDCLSFEVFDKDNSHLGVLILDMFPRDEKRGGAWCGAYRMRTYDLDGTKDQPIVTVVANFTKPVGSTPALLSLDEVETFFHEFGHALHFLFTDVPYTGLQEVEQDFVELPSQMLENWATEPQMLKRYALHHRTNQVIPDDLIKKIQNSAVFNQGFRATELFVAMFTDMDIHTIEGGKPADITEFEKQKTTVERGLISQIAPRYRYPYFMHIFASESYSAGYYSYVWSEVYDKDSFEAFVETGDIFSRTVADKFRGEVLSKGGSADGNVLYNNFRGKDADVKYLLYGRGLLERPAPAAEEPIVEEETTDDMDVAE